MPGPVSDSFDPEWGTSANANDIIEELRRMHRILGEAIGSPPRYILDIVADEDAGREIRLSLRENDLRILRFACERASESI